MSALRPWLRTGLDRSLGPWMDSAAGGGSAGLALSSSSFLAGRGRGLNDDSRGSRMTLRDTVQKLNRRVSQDWEGTTVSVAATDQDVLQVAFHLGTVDAEHGVHAYMHVLSKDTAVLGQLGLRKASQSWGVRRDFPSRVPREETDVDSWLLFSFVPKWVATRPADALHVVRPRTGGSPSRTSPAGT
ncbi:unnamed protein product, partial [Prorocentrum cordatum]